MNNEIILKTSDIKKHFTGTYALKGVSVELKKGEIHALVGENGAGKSTLMNIISGVFPADSGNELPSLPHSTPRLHGQPSDGLNGSYSLWHPSQKIHG